MTVEANWRIINVIEEEKSTKIKQKLFDSLLSSQVQPSNKTSTSKWGQVDLNKELEKLFN